MMPLPRLIASGFGCGYAPGAPGTAGSLLGLALGTLILLAGGPLPLVFIIILASAAGIWSISAISAGLADPGWVVIDEIAGQMIAMLGLSQISPAGLLLAFCLFRFFDILKPGPIAWADSHHNPWGVMGDDWLAGAFALLALLLLRIALPGHGL